MGGDIGDLNNMLKGIVARPGFGIAVTSVLPDLLLDVGFDPGLTNLLAQAIIHGLGTPFLVREQAEKQHRRAHCKIAWLDGSIKMPKGQRLYDMHCTCQMAVSYRSYLTEPVVNNTISYVRMELFTIDVTSMPSPRLVRAYEVPQPKVVSFHHLAGRCDNCNTVLLAAVEVEG